MNVTNKKTETLQQFDLTLKKVVEGEYADMNTAFSFTITLKDQTGAAVNDSFDVVTSDGVSADSISNGKISFTNGEATVSLAHEQEITIKNLPEGYVYVIQETLDGNQLYNKSIKVNGKSVSGQSEGSTGDRTMSEDETVIYTNRSKDIVPAGIHTNLQSLAVESILVLLLVCGMVCIYTMRRRRK
jgi:hypothetical protein